MKRYRAKATLFVAGSRIRAGETFASDAPPGPEWEPIAETAAAKAPEPAKEAPRRVQTPQTTAPPPPPVDPFADKDEAWLRNFIATKGGKTPGQNASIETLRQRARDIVTPDGGA